MFKFSTAKFSTVIYHSLAGASFCKAIDKKCTGDVIYGYPITLVSGQGVTDCLKLCAHNEACQSVGYKDKVCTLHNYRCGARELSVLIGGSYYFRLGK